MIDENDIVEEKSFEIRDQFRLIFLIGGGIF